MISSKKMPCPADGPLVLGLDAGSVSFKYVIADRDGNLLADRYERTLGRPVETALRVLGELLEQFDPRRFAVVAGTGSAGRLICQILGIPFINELICQAAAIKRVAPQVRTLIEMGGQDSKMLFLPEGAGADQTIVDFAMNTNCAAGTGSFLDQQASRLGINIEGQFGELALKSVNPPRVAGRCSVFAKSDMIHLQQQATPDYDIVAGLCLGLARNLKGNLGRGHEIIKPIAFAGGVAANKGVVRAMETVFELSPGELVVPACHATSGAYGAALVRLAQNGLAHPALRVIDDRRLAKPLDEETCKTADQVRAATEQFMAAEGNAPVREPAPHVLDLAPLREHLAHGQRLGHELAPLGLPSKPEPDSSVWASEEDAGTPGRRDAGTFSRRTEGPRAATKVPAYLGLDVGSISTKIAVIDAQNRVLGKCYLMTAGRPLEAVRKCLAEVGRQISGRVDIRGAATTGSGRYLTGDFIGADLVINEITAQAHAAALIDPAVDTIFEIGGQDSKFISLDGGVVVDFEMNHACAAGTGSFLEEQAERLGINIKQQFAQLATSASGPIKLGERCTVFMESDLLNYQQQGAATDDLVAGLAYSIVANYINRVVGHRRIGNRIFFQGGTAFNRAVVVAFEKVTGKQITVPPHHEVTGAIGAAALARKHMKGLPHSSGTGTVPLVGTAQGGQSPFPKKDSEMGTVPSSFRGFDLSDIDYQVRSFECTHCSNNCEINEVTIAGREPLYYGSRCDRYNVKKQSNQFRAIPNLFVERNRLLHEFAGLEMTRGEAKTDAETKDDGATARGRDGATDPKSEIRNPKAAARKTVGIPLALGHLQLLPFWGTLLRGLGLNVIASPMSNRKIIHDGVEAVAATPCFPVKVAHGHVLDLLARGVDYIWLPSVVSLPDEYPETDRNQLCPYVQTIPYQVSVALEAACKSIKVLKPVIRMQEGRRVVARELRSLCKELGLSPAAVPGALAAAYKAQQDFEDACRNRGREVLGNLAPGSRNVVIVSRPYNGCDAGVSLDLPNKLRRLGVLPIPMDFLDMGNEDLGQDRIFQNMYWKYGQKILRAGKLIREDSRLHAVYLSNFSCGPDSFIINFFKQIMGAKPALVLEVDEHSADAGVVTRLEAFLESLANAGSHSVAGEPYTPIYPRNGDEGCGQRTIYVPWMGDVSVAMAAAFRAKGQPSEVLPLADQDSLQLGRRYTSGKECLPCIVTTGDMLRKCQEPGFDADRAAFLMPGGSGPCRFGQYNCLHKLVLMEVGMGGIPVVAPSQDKQLYKDFKQFKGNPSVLAWRGIAAIDVLFKALLTVRPYEVTPGTADAAYNRWVRAIELAIESDATTAKLAVVMADAADDFTAISQDRSRVKPKIGIVGEIYVRSHTFSNNDLIRQLEALGASTALASFAEWIYYTNFTRKRSSLREWSFGMLLGNVIRDRVQRTVHRRLARPFEALVPDVMDPPVRHILDLANPYIHDSFEGEAVLSVGKMIEFCHSGCDGVVNVMPFTCMPSTIVSGLTKRIVADLGGMPVLSISYDGQQDPTLQTRLEAFVYQAEAFHRRRASLVHAVGN